MSTTYTNHVKRTAPPSIPKPKKHKPHHPNIVALFEKRYRIQIRVKDIRSIEEQRMRGDLASGNKAIDRALQNEKQIIPATINEMVEYYRDGVAIWLTHLPDAKKIYDAVCAHTAEWRRALMYGMNMGGAPVEDLILMEEFVSRIYQHARFEYEKPTPGHSARGSLSDFLFSRDRQMGTIAINGEYTVSEGWRAEGTVKDQVHIPDTDVFKQALVSSMNMTHHGN